jgi:hypothetical protein
VLVLECHPLLRAHQKSNFWIRGATGGQTALDRVGRTRTPIISRAVRLRGIRERDRPRFRKIAVGSTLVGKGCRSYKPLNLS